MADSLTVVKLGGSLLDLPELGHRLRAWLDGLGSSRVFVVVGGGRLVEAIRLLDQELQLGEEPSHWLAVRAMSVNSEWVASFLPRSQLIRSLAESGTAWDAGLCAILDPLSFLKEDDRSVDHLPHSWDVTGDSIAARVAIVGKADTLVLLKSRSADQEKSWPELAKEGFVDAWFPRLAPLIPNVHVVDLRSFTAGS